MPVTKEMKKQIVAKFGKNAEDTGSAEVQIALLSDRITVVTGHLQKFKHDFASKQGLLKMVAQRRKLLKYLSVTNPSKYATIVEQLELKK